MNTTNPDTRSIETTLEIHAPVEAVWKALTDPEELTNWFPLKALAGKWEGQRTDGVTVKVTYQVLGGGSTLVERTDAGDEPAMLTVYHRDNDDLRMTHFCSAGNQPRMKATSVSPDAREISFEFVDVTNLQGPNDGYINSLSITFEDSDNITQKWGWAENGQQEYTVVSLARVK